MSITYKVSSNSGWLRKGKIYKVSDLEGEEVTAQKFLDSNSATIIEDPKALSSVIVQPYHNSVQEDLRTETAESIRRKTAERQR